MNKLLLGALLMATSLFAQTPPKAAQHTPTKPTASSATMAKASKPVTSNKPLPDPPLKEKMESGDDAIPSYKLEKDHGIHKGKGPFSPRRTASGARKDTAKHQ